MEGVRQARPHPDMGHPGGRAGDSTGGGTHQENTLFIYAPEMPGGFGRGQPTGWVSAHTVIFWHQGPGGAGPGWRVCEVQGLTTPGAIPVGARDQSIQRPPTPTTSGALQTGVRLAWAQAPASYKNGGGQHGVVPPSLHWPGHVPCALTQGFSRDR